MEWLPLAEDRVRWDIGKNFPQSVVTPWNWRPGLPSSTLGHGHVVSQGQSPPDARESSLSLSPGVHPLPTQTSRLQLASPS